MSSLDSQDRVRKALQAGTIGYLRKDTPVDVLADAIRAAHTRWPGPSPEEHAPDPAVPARR